MTTQNENFDLAREKKELDIFLSTFTSAELDQPPRVPRMENGPSQSAVMSDQNEPANIGSRDRKPAEKTIAPGSNRKVENAGGLKNGTDGIVGAGTNKTTPLPKKTGNDRQEKEDAAPLQDKSTVTKRPSRMRTGILFAIFVVVTIGYLCMYPETGYRIMHRFASGVPFFDQIVLFEKDQRAAPAEQVIFVNVRQRLVNNASMGDIRVVEGLAVNQSALSLAKIKVIGKLYNSRGTLLAERISLCGNIITDEKLGILSEEEIQTALSVPSGSDVPYGKILPASPIPFMIVFTREPADVDKATVTLLDAEKLP
jgi:hypothetical protein